MNGKLTGFEVCRAVKTGEGALRVRMHLLTAVVSPNLGTQELTVPPPKFLDLPLSLHAFSTTLFWLGTDYDKSTSVNPLPTFQSLLSHASRMQ